MRPAALLLRRARRGACDTSAAWRRPHNFAAHEPRQVSSMAATGPCWRRQVTAGARLRASCDHTGIRQLSGCTRTRRFASMRVEALHTHDRGSLLVAAAASCVVAGCLLGTSGDTARGRAAEAEPAAVAGDRAGASTRGGNRIPSSDEVESSAGGPDRLAPRGSHLALLAASLRAEAVHRQARDPSHGLLVPRHAVLLLHGLLGFDRIGGVSYFRGIKEYLESLGIRVYTVRVAPTGSVRDRAIAVQAKLEQIGEPVNVIAHSMGGLDARYVVTHFDKGKRVKSLVTISTPHRGTYFADWGMEHIGEGLGVESLLHLLDVPTAAFKQLTRENMMLFNLATPDIPTVKYYSIGGCRPSDNVFAAFAMSASLIRGKEGYNDGLVSLRSAKWGKWLGAVPADHAEEIGWRPSQVARGMLTLRDTPGYFSARRLYNDICTVLAADGL